MIEENVSDYIVLQRDCIPVKGAAKSALYDLTRQKIHTFPTKYFSLFYLLENNTLELAKRKAYEAGLVNEYNDLLEFLKNEEMIFSASLDEKKLFPKIDLSNDFYPGKIKDSIIEVGGNPFYAKKFIEQLDLHGCEYIQIRQSSSYPSMNNLNDILSACSNTSIMGIELLLPHNDSLDEMVYYELIKKNPLIYSITIYNYSEDKVVYSGAQDADYFKRYLIFSTKVFSGSSCCGTINRGRLIPPSTEVVAEFMNSNSCLNMKVSLREDGTISNCPAMKVTFGHINDGNISDIIESEEYTKFYQILKDQIDTCKDCEYRYACSDCRAHTENGDILGKPSKCSYNPYTGVWCK